MKYNEFYWNISAWSLTGIGFICCMLRILFCICPSHCIANSKNARKKNGNKVDADHTTSLLRGESKRVSIARTPGQHVSNFVKKLFYDLSNIKPNLYFTSNETTNSRGIPLRINAAIAKCWMMAWKRCAKLQPHHCLCKTSRSPCQIA